VKVCKHTDWRNWSPRFFVQGSSIVQSLGYSCVEVLRQGLQEQKSDRLFLHAYSSVKFYCSEFRVLLRFTVLRLGLGIHKSDRLLLDASGLGFLLDAH